MITLEPAEEIFFSLQVFFLDILGTFLEYSTEVVIKTTKADVWNLSNNE